MFRDEQLEGIDLETPAAEQHDEWSNERLAEASMAFRKGLLSYLQDGMQVQKEHFGGTNAQGEQIGPISDGFTQDQV